MNETESASVHNSVNADATHWQILRTALCERIRSRWRALARLSPDAVDTDDVESALTAADTPGALLRLIDQVDRRLDAAFAPRSRRTR
ncbi:MAG: hypothetical protein AB1752_13370, partial [Candidatus Zixiibacteriota bacterium]